MVEAEPGGAARDEEAVSRFVERFALDLVQAGMPRMASRVFAGLLVSDDARRTAAEIADMLQISPAAVSGAVRYLVQVGLVAREREPGRRRDHYRVRDDLWYETVMQRDGMLAAWEATLSSGIEALGADTAAGRRLEDTRSFFAFLRRRMPELLVEWRRQRTAAEP